MAREAGLGIDILDEKRIEELKMGALLGVALWLSARFSTAYFAGLALRDEATFLVLIVVGTLVYAAAILALFGRNWLRLLLRG